MSHLIEMIAWNTGRRYTSAGQRIAAGYTEDHDVFFVDIDRCIEMKLAKKRPEPFDISSFSDWVMTEYDYMRYTWPTGQEEHDIISTLRATAAVAEIAIHE